MEKHEYVRRVLAAYRAMPGTSGTVRRADRLLAAQLHERAVPLEAVENAFLLAKARRMIRPSEAPSLETIRSLAYFVPVIKEVLEMKNSKLYFQYVRSKLQRIDTAS
jgi:hypothetical protein